MYKTHLFGKPTIIVSIPETCKKVLFDDEQFKLGYPASTQRLFGKNSLHNRPNEDHRRIRRIITAPINGDQALSIYLHHIEDVITKSLEEWASMRVPFEFVTEMRSMTFKVITQIFMGSELEIDSVLAALVMDLYSDLSFGLRSLAINIPGFAFYRALQAKKKLVRIFESVLAKKRAMVANRDMMSLLMEVKEENGKSFEDEDIIDLLIAFLLAGLESTPYVTFWAVFYLTQHPEFFQKAKEEQEKIIKRRPPTQKGLSLKEIKQMDYLNKVINEAQRKTSLAFANFREAKVDVVMNGFIIPKGWKVMIWTRAVHMDPEVHPNPKAFDPERWDNNKMKAGSFLAFGAGSRICPGSDLSKLQMSVFLHHFLLNYKLEYLNPKAAVTYLPVPKPKDNCIARVIKSS